MKLPLRTDDGGVNSHHFCEIPIIGPGRANRLVVISGIANSGTVDGGGLDVNRDDFALADVFITTDYHLDKEDNWQNIADKNVDLLAATYVSLASIAADDQDSPGTPTGFVFALNSVRTRVNEEDGRRVLIHLEVALQGDSTLGQIAYQANIIIQKAV